MLLHVLCGEDTIEFFETFGEVGGGVEPHRIADFIDAAVVFGQHLRGHDEPFGADIVVGRGVEQSLDLAVERRFAQTEGFGELFVREVGVADVGQDDRVEPREELLVAVRQVVEVRREGHGLVLEGVLHGAPLVEDVPDAGLEILHAERLFDVEARAALHAHDFRPRRGERREEDHRDVRGLEIPADTLAEFQSAHAVQGDVREDEVRLLLAEQFQRPFGGRGGEYAVFALQLASQVGREIGVVFHDEQRRKSRLLRTAFGCGRRLLPVGG